MRATHKGSCQACGAVQMLPDGKLAKHGYTTRWGFFSGVCQGSGFQAYEKGFDRIQDFIRWAEAKREDLIAFEAALLAPVAEDATEAWVRVYHSGNYTRVSGYAWEKKVIDFRKVDYTSGDGFYLAVTYKGEKDRNERIDGYNLKAHGLNDERNPVEWLQALNAKRAAVVREEIGKIGEYIRWQEKRITDWKEEDLLPR